MKSHGDGRRMTVAEAIERRARIIRVHGGLADAMDHARPDTRTYDHQTHDRRWAYPWCESSTELCLVDRMAPREAVGEDDVELDEDGIPVAACAECRGEA